MEISKNNTQALKGLCILMIVMHHYTQNFGFFPKIFCGFGPIGCAVFFFISGFGLSKGHGDLKKWKTRFLRICIPFLLANILYYMFFMFAENKSYSLLESIYYIIGFPSVNFHWFIQVLLLLYFTGFVADICLKSNYLWLCCLSIIVGLLFTSITFSPGTMSWITFPFGVICANKQMKISGNLLFLISLIFIFIFTFYYYYEIGKLKLNSVFLVVNYLIMCLAVPFLFISIGNISDKIFVFKKMGDASIDIYFSHFLVIFVFNHLALSGLRLFAGFAVSVIVASFLFGFTRKIISKHIIS